VPVPASWSSHCDKVVRLTVQTVKTTQYRFSAAPVTNLNFMILLGDLPLAFVSSAWGGSQGAGSAVLVGVYATTNGAALHEITLQQTNTLTLAVGDIRAVARR
jgi:hypothetical protein